MVVQTNILVGSIARWHQCHSLLQHYARSDLPDVSFS